MWVWQWALVEKLERDIHMLCWSAKHFSTSNETQCTGSGVTFHWAWSKSSSKWGHSEPPQSLFRQLRNFQGKCSSFWPLAFISLRFLLGRCLRTFCQEFKERFTLRREFPSVQNVLRQRQACKNFASKKMIVLSKNFEQKKVVFNLIIANVSLPSGAVANKSLFR